VNPRVLLGVLSVEARKLMSYRVDFWANTLVGTLSQFALAWFLWAAILTEPGQTVEGYTLEGIVLYYALVLLLGRLVSGPQNPTDISQEIYDGSLSRYLLLPTGYFGVKYAQRLGLLVPSLVQAAVLGTLYLALAPLPAGDGPSLARIGMALAALCLANLLHFLLLALVQLAAFWADNVWSLVVMVVFVSRLLGGSWIPLDTFPAGVRGALRWLPFEYLFGFPVDTLMGRVEPGAWAWGMVVACAWTAGLAGLVSLAWRRGTLRYTGVGI
jgi:ABC-2 type transport system permease protein